jgi:hypothetical protein
MDVQSDDPKLRPPLSFECRGATQHVTVRNLMRMNGHPSRPRRCCRKRIGDPAPIAGSTAATAIRATAKLVPATRVRGRRAACQAGKVIACRLIGTLQWVVFSRASRGKRLALLEQQTPVLGLDPLENQLLIETLSGHMPSLVPHPLGCVAFAQNP